MSLNANGRVEIMIGGWKSEPVEQKLSPFFKFVVAVLKIAPFFAPAPLHRLKNKVLYFYNN